MRLVALIANLFLGLPWWGALLVGGAIVGLFIAMMFWIKLKFDQIPSQVLAEMSAPLASAQTQLHEVKAVLKPSAPSAFDGKEGDEHYDPEIDGPEVWDEAGPFYSVDVTITPNDPEARWTPGSLTLIPASHVDVPGENPVDLGMLHTVELYRDGRFVALEAEDEEVTGTQRVRLLTTGPESGRNVKFCYWCGSFGGLTLPAPLPQPASR
jgi:hypothetical protein